jgi:hypothetical protein
MPSPAASVLGLRQGLTRGEQQSLGRLPMHRCHRHADADDRIHQLAACGLGRGKIRQQPAGRGRQPLQPIGMGEQHRKPITIQPCRVIAVRAGRLDARGQRGQHLVAGGLADIGVDVIKPIQIDQ